MIGNDIVDLDLAAKQSNWRRPNYLEKICTEFEINAIKNSENPDLLIWQIWSRKEAVYKVLLQMGFEKGYYPKRINCLNFEEIGKVAYENNIFFTKTIETSKSIHSVAVQEIKDFSLIRIPSPKSIVIKENDIPFLFLKNKKFSYSKSHHGRFEIEIFLNSV